MSKLMNDSFVIVHLDVMENGDKKSLENPGGDKYMRDWGGATAGLPFMVILDANGKKLTDSIEKKTDGTVVGNTGYPAKPNEIAWFMGMLGSSRSKLTGEQAKQVRDWLTEHAPKG